MSLCGRSKWVRFFIWGSTKPFGMAPRFTLPFADLSQSAFASRSVFDRSLGGTFFIGMDICRRRFWVRLLPKPLGDLQCIDVEVLPPDHFIASLMQLPMMAPAERYGELVADFETERSGLGRPQVMRIGWLAAADETGLRGDESQM